MQGAAGQLCPHAPQSTMVIFPQLLGPPGQGAPWLRFTHIWSWSQ
jgi:hypothetical protein